MEHTTNKNGNKKTRVFIVDDHDLIREGLRKILKQYSDIDVVGEARSSEELLDRISGKKVDIIVLDISLPGRSGLEILSGLRKVSPMSRILMLSMFPEERFAVRALKAGASGYVTKQGVSQELVKAIRKIAGGGKYISPGVAEQLIEETDAPNDAAPHGFLSNRELEILLLISSGASVGRIARQMSLSINTVTTYRSRLLKKMKMKTNAELIRYALDHRLLDR